MAWYPISDILLNLCGLVTAAVIILGVVIGYGPQLTDRMVDLMAESFNQQSPGLAPNAQSLAQTKVMIVLLLPMIQGGIWVTLLFAAFYFALRIVSRSGRALRPREDMPSALRMNRNAIFVFLAGIVLMFAAAFPP